MLASPLPRLTLHFAPKGIPTAAGAALCVKRVLDGAPGEAAQRLAIAAGAGHVVAVVGGRGGQGRRVELDAAILVGGAGGAEEAAVAAARVAVAGAAHDVSEADASRLAVPQAEAQEDEGEGGEGDGQGDEDGGPAGGRERGRGVEGGTGDDDGQGDGRLLLVAALGGGEEGDCHVVGGAPHEVFGGELKGPVPPPRGDAVVGVELDHQVARLVEVVEADGHVVGDVGAARVVVEVGIPGDLGQVSGGSVQGQPGGDAP